MSTSSCFYSGILTTSSHGNNGTCFTFATPATSNHFTKTNHFDKRMNIGLVSGGGGGGGCTNVGDHSNTTSLEVARINPTAIGYEVVSVNALTMTAADLQNLVHHPQQHHVNASANPATTIYATSNGNYNPNIHEENKNNIHCDPTTTAVEPHHCWNTITQARMNMNQNQKDNLMPASESTSSSCSSSSTITTLSNHAPICRDFLRSACRRGKRCRFRHVAQDEKDSVLQTDGNGTSCYGVLSSPLTCHDYQNHACNRFNCRFLHLTRMEEDHYRATGELPAHAIRQMVENGQAYADETPLCKDYQNGHCHRGSRCKYRHVETNTNNYPPLLSLPSSTNQSLSLQQQQQQPPPPIPQTQSYWPPYTECIFPSLQPDQQQQQQQGATGTLYPATVIASTEQHLHLPSSIVFTSPQTGQILSLPSSTASGATISTYQHTQPMFVNPGIVASSGAVASITPAALSTACCLTPHAAAAMVGGGGGGSVQHAGNVPTGSNTVMPPGTATGTTTALLVPATMATLQPIAASSLSDQNHHVLTPAQVTIIPAVSATAVHDASNIVTITNARHTVPCSAVHMSATGDLLTVLPTLSLTRSQPSSHSLQGVHPTTVTLISASSANALEECSSQLSSRSIISTAHTNNTVVSQHQQRQQQQHHQNQQQHHLHHHHQQQQQQHHHQPQQQQAQSQQHQLPVDCTSTFVQTSFSTSSCTSAEDSISRCSSNGTTTHASMALSESGGEESCDKLDSDDRLQQQQQHHHNNKDEGIPERKKARRDFIDSTKTKTTTTTTAAGVDNVNAGLAGGQQQMDQTNTKVTDDNNGGGRVGGGSLSTVISTSSPLPLLPLSSSSTVKNKSSQHHSTSYSTSSSNSCGGSSSGKASQRHLQQQQQQLSMLKQMDELHRENRELRRALDDMKKQNGDLRAANEVLLDQNARLRNKSHRHDVSKASAVALPHFIQTNTLTAASVCPMLPTVSVLSAVAPAQHQHQDSRRNLPNAQCLSSSTPMTLYSQPSVSHSAVL